MVIFDAFVMTKLDAFSYFPQLCIMQHSVNMTDAVLQYLTPKLTT